ncbi:glycoside hydrolase family 73 protein [Flavilitoribacter nigricans]|uniref:Mannosyl-glycoprotein endo-beta-N-acetylglucosamidase n=1 Tax=Flavilitoribacter nigricans (strain ATCC 23147 / DSM 23189 / NBRC 102662 / NCIMB 1420 / SS-2) TaxID=1122177 RepID=A0A2D0N630_FLAN2|nr:glucosaminidase domain-containing protein [Flavilitoribacter nigricans]PHN03982.1 mannosyl-glycoprotein endo-beta-N-acetylglucosamidase [Flavilitoribacter nigricans DSM 23189 = NBRC 102662]
MHQKLQLIKASARAQFLHWRYQTENLVRRYWLRAFFLGLGAFLLIRKDVSINLNLNSVAQPMGFYEESTGESNGEQSQEPMNVSKLTSAKSPAPAAQSKAMTVSHLTTERKPTSKDPNLANTYSNVNKYSDEDLARRAAKRKKQLAYVQRYYKIAQKEMEQYKIPASITLAQGLLESNVGESRLATKNNNHFGIKCFSRKCKKGHCSNFTDDSHKDFFRKYRSAWESFRAHSQLLKAKRYQPLYDLSADDYRGWAKGLKKAGYATDPNYAEKIIELIDDLELFAYDE